MAPTHRIEAAVVHLASTAADLLGFGGEGGVATPLDAPSWELVGLAPEDIGPVADEVAAQFDAVAKIMLEKAA